MRAIVLAVVVGLIAAQAVGAGLPWPFNMRVESCAQRGSDAGVVVTTTGAVLDVRPGSGEIVLSQRIGEKRIVGKVVLAEGLLRGLKRTSSDDEVARFETEAGLKIEVHCDSVLRLTCAKAVALKIEGTFAPEYLRETSGAALALDEHGGFGAYFIDDAFVKPAVKEGGGGFTLTYDLAAEKAALIAVCPPREYDWKRDREDRIVHYFPALVGTEVGWSDHPLPSDEELKAWREFNNVLVLHLETWNGYMVAEPKARDEKRLREALVTARKLGYRTLIYCSPLYFGPAYQGNGLRDDAVALFLKHARWMLQTYGFDGVYWDGVFTDVPKAWELAREMRKALGSWLFYFHSTGTPLPYWQSWSGVYCPFVDTYADYQLRGEGMPREHIDPIYLRYEASGYNISNTIGTLCYETCRVDKTMFDWALEAMVHIPYWPGGQDVAGKKYFLTPEEDKLFREYYLPKAAEVRGPEDYAKLAGEGFASREARRREIAEQRKVREAALHEYLAAQKAKATAEDLLNLAAFKPATCSDYCTRPEGPHLLGYRTEYATDLNPETYWAADMPPAHWIAVDLGRVEHISRVRVLNYYGDKRFYHYRVETSIDGEVWALVGEKANDNLATTEGDYYNFAARDARYIRVTMLSNSANCGVHVAEVGVWR
jgi:hypothetical protein